MEVSGQSIVAKPADCHAAPPWRGGALMRAPPALYYRRRSHEEMSDSREPARIFEEDAGVRQKPRLEEPRLYRVLLHNDHYTTMDFVVKVVVSVFHKSAAEATKIMLDVHRKGRGVVGVYTLDIAATKVSQVHEMARQGEFPLRASWEEA
jgi:ATP-dependent Clp protease adaptor protein ClpS